jgi:hypothetical protein
MQHKTLTVIFLVVSAALLCTRMIAAAPAPPRGFSADIVQYDAAGRPVGTLAHLLAAETRVRIEVQDSTGGYYLIDGSAGTALFVQPAQGFYLAARRSSPLTQIFVPIDPLSPCSQWQRAAIDAGVPHAAESWDCERVGVITIGGREALEYRVKAADQSTTLRWISCQLGITLGFKAADGSTFRLEHLQAGPPPAGEFAIPHQYRQLDPQGLLERIKQSDVWVE